MGRTWIGWGGLFGFIAVVLSAASTHVLPGRLDAAAMHMLDSGIQMQVWHALALVAVGVWAPRGGWLARLAGLAFVLGTLAFCGGVYAIALLGQTRVPSMAPLGGTLLMLGGLLLAASSLRR